MGDQPTGPDDPTQPGRACQRDACLAEAAPEGGRTACDFHGLVELHAQEVGEGSKGEPRNAAGNHIEDTDGAGCPGKKNVQNASAAA